MALHSKSILVISEIYFKVIHPQKLTYRKVKVQTRRSHYSERISSGRSLPLCGTSGDAETPHGARDLWREKHRHRGKTADSDGACPLSQNSESGRTDQAPLTGNECAMWPNHWRESSNGGWSAEEYWALELRHCVEKRTQFHYGVIWLQLPESSSLFSPAY